MLILPYLRLFNTYNLHISNIFITFVGDMKYSIVRRYNGKLMGIVTQYEDEEHAKKICEGMNEACNVPLVVYKVEII